MNSNTLRYVAGAGYFVVMVLSVVKVITTDQALQIVGFGLAAKEFGQSFLTPATNQRTPDAIVPKA